MPNGIISLDESILCVVDVQEKLLPHIANGDKAARATAILVRGARTVGVPILVTEQVPDKLGPTVADVTEALGGTTPIEKDTFSCLGSDAFRQALAKTERTTLILCGIEAHVCVLQTALQAVDAGLRAVVVADAIGSRLDDNRQLALARLRQDGATVASVEMILMEWIGGASHPNMRDIIRLIK